MMENFSHIIKHLLIASGTSSSSDHFGGTSPFKVQVNFDILVFEGRIDTEALEMVNSTRRLFLCSQFL
jgi:hypothetical protein